MGKFSLFIIITLIVLAFATLVILIFLRTNALPSPEPTKDSPLPTKTAIPIPNYPTSTTIQSSGVKINNPFLGAKEFTTQGDALSASTEEYRIVYLKQFDEFVITIEKEPFEENRKTAERNFLVKLGIPEGEACKLKVSVSPPKKKGELTPRYKLSFCPK